MSNKFLTKTKYSYQTAMIGIILAVFIFQIPSALAINTTSEGYDLIHGTTVQVQATTDSGVQCFSLTNNSPNDYFVPTKMAAEWNAFMAHVPLSVVVGSCDLGDSTPLVINDCMELQLIGNDARYLNNGNYTINPISSRNYGHSYIDCSATNPSSPLNAGSMWDKDHVNDATHFGYGGKGFMPICYDWNNQCNSFNGSLDGQGNVINNLYIYRKDATNHTGLFTYVSGGFIVRASVRNLGLINGSITGSDISSYYNGSLAGSISYTNISNCYNTGSVSDKNYAAGLIGNVSTRTSIINCYNTGPVTSIGSAGYVGGLVFQFGGSGTTMSNSYNTGTITASGSGGGLTYSMSGGTISKSYNTGLVSSKYMVGGLVAYLSGSGIITDSYNTGSVLCSSGSSAGGTGGLAGRIRDTSSITKSYNKGLVSGGTNVGGLVGLKTETADATYSYFDTQTSGQTKVCGAGTCSSSSVGYPTATTKMQSTYSGWDFSSIWRITEGVTYPCHKWWKDLGGSCPQ